MILFIKWWFLFDGASAVFNMYRPWFSTTGVSYKQSAIYSQLYLFFVDKIVYP